jgi:regulator of sirC expression with transglutaminase-like and TPR domain
MSQPFAHNPEFSKLCAGRDDIDLVAAMFELAGDAYPRAALEAGRHELNRLRTAAADRVRQLRSADLAERLEAVSDLLYCNEGFRGNREAYYDPRNSYLNEVLARRCGIPISLGIIYMHVAAGSGIPVCGVPTPGHFMLAAQERDQQWFIDPFTEGEVLDPASCRRRVSERIGESADPWLRAATHLEIVVRVLRNLKAAYAMDDRWTSIVPVQQRLVALLPDHRDEQRDLALIFLRSGQPHTALELLTRYLDGSDPDTARQMEPFLRTARKLAAEMN